MWKFFFEYEGTTLMIPIAAPTEGEARTKLRIFILGWAGELVPTSVLSPMQTNTSGGLEAPTMPEFGLELRIEDLVRDLTVIKKPKGANTLGKLVKEWTGFPMEPQNYKAIISELEKQKKE